MDCVICNKRIKYSKNWNRHINGKAHIKKAIAQAEKDVVIQQNEKMETPSSNRHPNVIQMSSSLRKCKPEPIESFNCQYCNKSFKYRQGRHKHEKSRCKVRQGQEAMNAKIEALEKRLAEAESKGGGDTTNNNNCTTNINNNDNRSINNTINLNVYGQEAIIFDEEFLYRLQNDSLTDVQRCKMIMDKVFIETEENRTLQLTNLRSVFGKIFNGTDWHAANAQEMIDNRINKLPITYNRGATACINGWDDADDLYKKEQIAIHSNFSNQIRINTIKNEKDRKEISEAHKLDCYNYH